MKISKSDNLQKIKIYTRSLNPILFSLSNEFLPADIERIRCINFNSWHDANNYLYFIIDKGPDWIINLDEDAFITNWAVVLDLIEYMANKEYEYCGMPDGGVACHRKNSWMVCNPFFNIFNTIAIRKKMLGWPRSVIDQFEPKPEMEIYKPCFIRGVYENGQSEPFNGLFYWLMSVSKGLFLDAIDHNDGFSTKLLWNNNTFLYHAWYTREFHYFPKKRQRTIKLYFEALNERSKH